MKEILLIPLPGPGHRGCLASLGLGLFWSFLTMGSDGGIHAYALPRCSVLQVPLCRNMRQCSILYVRVMAIGWTDQLGTAAGGDP